MRLRDLAGLVVIDFIDMEEPKNNYAVERRMKEALKKDSARIQMGRITGFGLMELSRQRLRSSLLETGHHVCPMCQGAGFVRSSQSSAMHVLHILEEAGRHHQNHIITIAVPLKIALYVLNNKRESLAQIEEHYDVQIKVDGDATLSSPTDYRLEYKALPPKEKGFFARTICSVLSSSKNTEVEEVKETPKAEEKKAKKIQNLLQRPKNLLKKRQKHVKKKIKRQKQKKTLRLLNKKQLRFMRLKQPVLCQLRWSRLLKHQLLRNQSQSKKQRRNVLKRKKFRPRQKLRKLFCYRMKQ